MSRWGRRRRSRRRAFFSPRALNNRKLRISLLHKRSGNPFTEGSRELFDLAGQGRIDVFFLGGAQIDGEANINLVQAEGKRFPGSFGSAFMYFAAGRTILFREEHSKRVLVPKVDFISAPGWSPPGSSAAAGRRRCSPARRCSRGRRTGAASGWRASTRGLPSRKFLT